jgi:hypothetical protein
MLLSGQQSNAIMNEAMNKKNAILKMTDDREEVFNFHNPRLSEE